MEASFEQLEGYTTYLLAHITQAQLPPLSDGTTPMVISIPSVNFIQEYQQRLRSSYQLNFGKPYWEVKLHKLRKEYFTHVDVVVSYILYCLPQLKSFEAYCQWRKLNALLV